MCLFSSSSRTNCFTEVFSCYKKKITNSYKGNNLIFPCIHVSRQNEMACTCCCCERGVDYHSSGASWWELPLLFPGKIARAMCTAMFPYLMILWEASITLRRGLIKIECHLVLKTIVRMTVWLVSSFTNKPGNTIYMYVWKGGICKDCYFSALPQTWHTQPFKSVPNLKLEMKATYLRGDLKYL